MFNGNIIESQSSIFPTFSPPFSSKFLSVPIKKKWEEQIAIREVICCIIMKKFVAKLENLPPLKKMPMTIDRIPSIRQDREQRARVCGEM